MNFILITGPPAVGKMSVGQSLVKKTGYKLFHNHQSIEHTLEYFDWGTPEFKKLNEGIRQLMFDTVSGSKLLDGFIFTLVWAFNETEDWDYVRDVKEKFIKNGWDFYIVELYAPLDTRLKRNKTSNRLLHKPSKRNLEKSSENLKVLEQSYQMSSEGKLNNEDNYIFLDNTLLSPDETAEIIIAKINFGTR